MIRQIIRFCQFGGRQAPNTARDGEGLPALTQPNQADDVRSQKVGPSE